MADCPVRVRHLLLTGARSPLARQGARLARAIRDRLDAEARHVESYDAWLERQHPLTSVV
ncbi:hypothetical protein VV01_03855 [Luteipulveratus halotolerans]|uniref:Uncharacterized protein n=1 Tax=Luteipulveratus halotolerans TaxID=1631356 RepID=A0A0L6CNE5_9MICO|nr:hypothetical protein VV01_03855 [Luteipulveratus halotolerans]